jgi:diguanylate cyclase (GGDEF)-like protein
VPVPDELTGVLTRRELSDAYERLVSSGEPVALLLMDADGFKRLNGAVGHEHGDIALVELANRLAAVVGPDAAIGRFGGDEFILLSNRWDRPAAERVVGQIARDLAANPVLRTESPHELTERERATAAGTVEFFGPDARGHFAIAPVRGRAPDLPLAEATPGMLLDSAYLSLSVGVALSTEVGVDFASLVMAAERAMHEQKRRLPDWREEVRRGEQSSSDS